MAKCYQLTIYEPDVNPRTVNLIIDPKDIETVRCPVFNEDGSLVRDYTVVTEDSDTEDGTRIMKDNEKEYEADLISKSKENCIQASENVHNFLSKYQMNSFKKEKKINRFKQIKEKLDAKKLGNKLKKQKNKMRKYTLTNNTQLDGSSNFNIGKKSKKIIWKNVRATINNSNSADKLIQDNEDNLIITNWKNKNQTERISQHKKKKQKKKNKAGIQNSQVVDQSVTIVNSHSCTDNQQMNAPNEMKSVSSQSNAESLKQVTTQSTSVSASDFILINPNSSSEHSFRKYPFFRKSKISTAWNANESAPDFIPINSGPPKKYSFQNTHSDRSSEGMYRKLKFQLSQHNERVSQCENEFMGISQKAFFLQC